MSIFAQVYRMEHKRMQAAWPLPISGEKHMLILSMCFHSCYIYAVDDVSAHYESFFRSDLP